jgi:hypothetical protein
VIRPSTSSMGAGFDPNSIRLIGFVEVLSAAG